MSDGIFAGPRMPYQVTTSNPGTPCSATVGILGTETLRCRPVTAINFARPALEVCIALVRASKYTETRPATKSVIAAGAPL